MGSRGRGISLKGIRDWKHFLFPSLRNQRDPFSKFVQILLEDERVRFVSQRYFGVILRLQSTAHAITVQKDGSFQSQLTIKWKLECRERLQFQFGFQISH